MSFIVRVFSLLIAGVMFIGVGANKADTHSTLDDENCKLNFAVLSDAHIEGNNLERYNAFGRILKDAKNTTKKNDAMVFLGDSTMNGQTIESLFFYGSVGKVDPAKQYINVIGNHDTNSETDDYDTLFNKYKLFTKSLLDLKVKKPYYYRVINGCYFIVVASEGQGVNAMYVSDEQLAWLDETLNLAEDDNAIAFVFSHHDMRAVYDQDDYAIRDILAEYNNVFYVYGHTHTSVTDPDWIFREDKGIHIVNLPRCTEQDPNDENSPEYTGFGAQVEVYEDEVVFRFRNYCYGTWAEDFEKHWQIEK